MTRSGPTLLGVDLDTSAITVVVTDEAFASVRRTTEPRPLAQPERDRDAIYAQRYRRYREMAPAVRGGGRPSET
jgi:hypothetical protein